MASIADLRDNTLAELPGVSVKRFGAKGDGKTDDTTAFESAIAYAAARSGGSITIPPGHYMTTRQLTIPSGVQLVAASGHYGYGAEGKGVAVIEASSAMPSIFTVADGATCAGIHGLILQGGGIADWGFLIPNASWSFVTRCSMDNFLDGFIKQSSGMATTIDKFLGTNAFKRGQYSSLVGSLDIDGTDHMISNVETGGGDFDNHAMTSGRFIAGVVLRGSTNFVHHLVSEFSERGIVLTSTSKDNHLTDCRADHMGGEGFDIDGSQNVILGCTAAEVGRWADNAFDAFALRGSRNCVGAGCRAATTGPNRPRYGVNDTVEGGEVRFRNRISADFTADYGTARVYTQQYEGSAPSIAYQVKRQDAISGTVDVAEVGLLRTWQTSQQTVTHLSGGVVGQMVHILDESGLTNIKGGGDWSDPGSISGADLQLAAGKPQGFLYFNQCWWPI